MYLPKEVPATLQLYLDGKMEQFWLRDNEAGVIFLMTVDSVEEAGPAQGIAARPGEPSDFRADADRTAQSTWNAHQVASSGYGKSLQDLETGKLSP
jgi:hypothetical protein